MGVSSAFNAAIAYTEENYDLAREYLRGDECGDPSTLLGRLDSAINKRECAATTQALKDILNSCLHLSPADDIISKEDYYKGVRAVEELLESYVILLGGGSECQESQFLQPK